MQKVSRIASAVAVTVGLVGTLESADAQSVFNDDYSNAAQSSHYGTDRTNPGGFTVNNGGNGVLNLSVLAADQAGQSDDFFNFHGIQTTGTPFNAPVGSVASVQVYVPSSWNSATAVRGGDFWLRVDDPTQPVNGLDLYPTIGVYNYGDGSFGGAHVSIYDPSDGAFVDIDNTTVPVNFNAFNTLGMQLTSTGVDFLFNGVLVSSDNDALTYGTPGTTIAQALLQGYQGDVDYTATYDNLNVSVPEPASIGVIGVAAAGLLLRRNRRTA